MNIIRRIFGKSADEIQQIEKQPIAGTNGGNSSAVSSDSDTSQDSETESTPSAENVSRTSTVELPTVDELSSSPAKSGATRPLNIESITHKQQVMLTFGKASDVGMVRDNNQDACLAMQLNSTTVDNRPDFGFFIVADGMGGHHDGERASAITVDTVLADMLETIYVPMLLNQDDSDRPTIVEALVSAAEKANRNVIKNVPDGGTTMTAVAVVGNLAYLAHVGDSRAYLVNNGDIEQLTRDHSLVQRLIELNQLTADEANEHPQKNVLYRAIGQNENLEVERLIRPLPEGAQMVLCSDGLWGLVDDQAILKIVLESKTPQDACDKLVALANTRGGTDNISVVILKIPSSK